MATETWIINETFDAYNASYDIAVSYTSGGRHFDQISFGNKSSTTYYALIYSYKDSDGIFHTVMPLNSGNWSISGYRTIIFDSPVTDANLLNWLQTRAVKKSNVSFKHHYKNTILIGSGTIKFRRYSITPPLSISYVLTNCTADSTNPTEIVAGKTYDFGFTADSGYEFTGSGTTSVSGGTIVAWDYPDSSDLTRITIAIEVTGNLTITQIASVALPQLATPQNVSADGTTVSWDEVENATSYAVLADGSEIGTVEEVADYILEAGTYKFIEKPVFGNLLEETAYEFSFTSNNSNFIYVKYGETGSGRTGFMFDTTTVYVRGAWVNQAYRTITIETDTQVSDDFYNWAITDGNLIKQ